MKKANIIVVVEGGIVQAVYSDIDVSVDVLDYDNLNADPKSEYENGVKEYLDTYQDYLYRGW